MNNSNSHNSENNLSPTDENHKGQNNNQRIQNPNLSPNYQHVFKPGHDAFQQDEEDSGDADIFLDVNLGSDAFDDDNNCPLGLSVVKHHLTEFQYHIKKQQNELFYINNNIKQIKDLLYNLHDENQTLQSIIQEFGAESKNKSRLLNTSELKTESNLPESDEYYKKVEDTFYEFVDHQTKLSNGASDLNQSTENIRMLKSMNESLTKLLKNNPESESDHIIDLLEDEIAKLESQNREMNLKYRDIIREKQREIDELEMQLNAEVESDERPVIKQEIKRKPKGTPKKSVKKKKKLTKKQHKE